MAKEISITTAKLIPNPKQSSWWNSCPWFYVDTRVANGYWMATRWDLDVDYPRPTQSLLAKFLRDEHFVHVTPCSHKSGLWNYMIFDLKDYGDITPIDKIDVFHTSFEDAYEAGLQQALKQLKK